jgi:fucose 4-O-acetylase-like acetyltransferase
MDNQPNIQAKKTWFAKAFNTAILKKSRLAWVDYLRGIAIILVVYRHALIGIQRGNITVPDALVNANMIFYSFRMPLFFILSGIFINSSIARHPFKKLLYSKFENLLYPYLVWVTIQVTLQILLARYTNSERTVHDYIFILTQPKLLDQFWYLPALFNCTIVYLLLKMKLHVPDWAQLFIGFGLYLLAPHIHNLSMAADWMEFYIFFAIGDLLSYLFFREGTQRFFKSSWTLLAVTPVFICTEFYYLHLAAAGEVSIFSYLAIALIGCFCMVVLAFRLQSLDILRFLRIVGFHSLFIYVMHVLVTAFTRAILTRVFHLHNPVALLACGITAGITIPIIFYNLAIKDNILYFLFTPKKPARKLPPATPPAKEKEPVSYTSV